MRLEPILKPAWPPLAWLAWCRRQSSTVTLFHGPQVDVAPDWACEAVWPGPFDDGAFDETDIVGGSGVRARAGHVTFVGEGGINDRLCSVETADGVWVSNSLPCVLDAAEVEVDPTYDRYWFDLHVILAPRYERRLPATSPRVRLTYFHNLVWDGRALVTRPKPAPRRAFDSFDAYRAFLEQTLAAVAANLHAASRPHAYTPIGTLSSGYDAATATTLARAAGCRQALCFDRTHQGDDDSGAPMAPYLGVEALVIDRDAWRAAVLPEVAFLAADGVGRNLFLRGAEPHLAGRVLFSGNGGDKTWGKERVDPRGVAIRSESGISIAEYRLRAGFLHCAIGFWGFGQMNDVVAVGNRPELAPWDLAQEYSRPICRRIVEEAGVPRELFGQHKRFAATMIHHGTEALTPRSWSDFLAWVRDHWGHWLRRGLVPPLPSDRLDRYVSRALAGVNRVSQRAADHARCTPGLAAAAPRLQRLADASSEPPYLRRYLFQWAIHHARKSYGL